MFILVLKYICPLQEIDNHLEAHIDFLNKYYTLKKFICSGRQNPRTGGIILCKCSDRNEVEAIIKEDPFYDKKLVEYEMIEFIPTKYAEEFKQLFS